MKEADVRSNSEYATWTWNEGAKITKEEFPAFLENILKNEVVRHYNHIASLRTRVYMLENEIVKQQKKLTKI